MNTSIAEGNTLASAISTYLSNNPVQSGTQIILSPPATHLQGISSIVASTENLFLSAQNCHFENSGWKINEDEPL